MRYRFSIRDAMEIAASKSGIADWQGYAWEAMGNGSVVTGCVPDGVYSRGPRKGNPRFSRPVEGTHRKVVISDSDMDVYAQNYEATTGKCFECRGTSHVYNGWSRDEGLRQASCERCGGSGVPKKA